MALIYNLFIRIGNKFSRERILIRMRLALGGFSVPRITTVRTGFLEAACK